VRAARTSSTHAARELAWSSGGAGEAHGPARPVATEAGTIVSSRRRAAKALAVEGAGLLESPARGTRNPPLAADAEPRARGMPRQSRRRAPPGRECSCASKGEPGTPAGPVDVDGAIACSGSAAAAAARRAAHGQRALDAGAS